MPIYRLKCRKCDREIEHRFTDRFMKCSKEEVEEAANFPCYGCGGTKWEKIPTVPGAFIGLPTEKFHKRGE